MSNIKQRLLTLNPDLFSGRQPSKEHEVFVVGRKEESTNNEGKKVVSIKYLLKSKPNAAATKAGIKIQDLIHAAFKPLGTIKTNENGTRSFSGPKKARTGVVFQNTQPDLYQFLKEGIYTEETDENGKTKLVMLPEESGSYKKAGFDAQKRPMLKLRDTVFGLKVSFNTDLYTPHSMDANGVNKPLEATTFNPKTGKYEKKAVVIGVYEFFADDDDLDKLLEVCMRHYQKHVAPYVTETVTTVTEKAGVKKVEVKEADATGPDDIIFDGDGNSVDEEGNILETAEELAARGVTAPETE